MVRSSAQRCTGKGAIQRDYRDPTNQIRLPIHDTIVELERQSIHALHAITISAGMLLRGEQFMEYGVKATLEIVVGDRATNFLAQIQINSI